MAVHSFIESEYENKKKELKRLWKDIVYSKTREEYEERLASLKDAVGSKHPLYQHVMKKWDPIKVRRVMCTPLMVWDVCPMFPNKTRRRSIRLCGFRLVAVIFPQGRYIQRATYESDFAFE